MTNKIVDPVTKKLESSTVYKGTLRKEDCAIKLYEINL